MTDTEKREQAERFAKMDRRQKLQYIWDYYKIPIIAVLVLILAVTSIVRDRMSRKETVLYIAMLDSNASFVMESNLLDDFTATLEGFDADREQMEINADYDASGTSRPGFVFIEKTVADYSAGIIDATIAPKAAIEQYAEHQAYGDLSEILPKELYDRLRSEGYELIEHTYEDPATGKRYEYPAAVNISDSSAIKAGFTDVDGNKRDYYDEDCYYAISPDTENMDNCVAFLEYLLDK